jgi:nucleotide-binding universal stress UspA family protein
MHAYERILVPIDFSTASVQAAKRAVQLAPPMGHVDLVHVAHVSMPAAMPAAELPIEEMMTPLDLQQNRELLESELRGLHEIVRALNPQVHVETRVVYGDPASVIIDESEHYDLIVVGASHRSRLSQLLLGSVAKKAVQDARCPVLVERDPEESAR